MLRQLPNLRVDTTSDDVRCIVKNTFLEVHCIDSHGEPVSLKRQSKRHSSDPGFFSPTGAYAASQTTDAKLDSCNEDACSTCTEDAMTVVSTCAASEVQDSSAQKRSASSNGSWASALSRTSKSSIGSTASKIFKFENWSTLKANLPEQKFEVGTHCETLFPVIVRTEEYLESEIVTELPIGTWFKIVELGEIDRRAKILAGSTLGWISVQTRLKEALIINREPALTQTVADFEVGGQHEVISAVTLRAGESLDSEVITELKSGTIVTIKELGQINNRRGKVVSQEAEGWISFTTRQGQLLLGKLSDKVDKSSGNAAGRLLFGTSPSQIKVFLESARAGDLEAMKNCIEGSNGFMGKLSRKPNLNCTDVRGKTALIYASAFGNTNIVDYLLSRVHEVDVNIVDDTQKSALHHASKRTEKTRRELGDECLELTQAGELGDDVQLQIAKALIYHGALVDARDHHGCSALMFAVCSCDAAMAKVLLDASANVNAKDYDGHTPLDHAKNFGYHKLVDMLKTVGAEGEESDREAPFADAADIVRSGTPDQFENDKWPGDWQSQCNPLLSVEAVSLDSISEYWDSTMCVHQPVSTDATRSGLYMPAENYQFTPMESYEQCDGGSSCERYEPSTLKRYEQSYERSWQQNSAIELRRGDPYIHDVVCEVPGHSPTALMATDDERTTLMVGNLSQDLTQAGFVQDVLDSGYAGLFDFVYMPMNFRGQGNFGYAFVNFASHHVAWNLLTQMKQPEYAQNPKVQKWNIVWSNCQGFDANVDRYRNSPLMHELVPMECKPAVYNHLGLQVAFPPPTKTISKPRIHRPKPEVCDGRSQNEGIEHRSGKVERRPR